MKHFSKIAVILIFTGFAKAEGLDGSVRMARADWNQSKSYSQPTPAQTNGSAPVTGPALTNPSVPGYYYDSSTQKYFTNGKTQFSIKSIENSKYLERIEYSVDDEGFQAYNGKLNLTTEGLHTVRFRAVDPVLNWSPVQVFRIYMDLTPPGSALSWKGPTYQNENTTFISTDSKLVISAEDNLAGTSKSFFKFDNQEPKEFSSELAFNRYEGPLKIQISSVDKVGNQEAWRDINFFVDNRAPETEASVQGASYRNGEVLYVHFGGQVSLVAKDQGSGIKVIEYQINNGNILPYTVALPISDKKMVLKFRATDWVGNQEPWRNIIIHQDSQPPKITLKENDKFISVSGKTYAKPGFSINLDVNDTESGIKSVLLSHDAKTYEPLTESKFVFDKPGEHTLNVRAVDQVGNMTEANPITVVIDNTNPVSEYHFSEKIVEKEGRVLSSLPNRLEIKSLDAGVGFDHVEISYDGKVYMPLEDSIDLATWREPIRTIHYRGIDRLGNTEDPKQVSIQVLTKGPIVDLFVESENLPNVPLSTIIKQEEVARPQREISSDVKSEVIAPNLPRKLPAKK
jgi:hypothetical protein